MGDFRLRRLDAYKTGETSNGMQLNMPLPKTPSGLTYRWCPNAECSPRRFLFGDVREPAIAKNGAATRRDPHSNGTTCPYCGTDGDDQDFIDPVDIEAAKDQVAWAMQEDVKDYLHGLLKSFNTRVGRGGAGFLDVKMSVKASSNPPPRPFRQDLLRDLTCARCDRRYGVYAIGLFCPDCGARNVSVHFKREMELVARQVELAERHSGEHGEELAYRLLGNAHEDVPTALETYLKTLFRFAIQKRYPERRDELSSKKGLGNAFQNVERARKRFEMLALDPFEGFSETEIDVLRLHIEKRHVVGHNLGLVDEHYAEYAQEEGPGQTVRILASEVSAFAELSRRVVAHVEEQLPELQPATAESAEQIDDEEPPNR